MVWKMTMEMSPITKAETMAQGMSSHHLLPCRAANPPRTADAKTTTMLIGPRQSADGGRKMLKRRTALAMPSFVDFVTR